MNEDIYIEYIQKDLLGTLAEDERSNLDNWIAKSEENKSISDKLYSAWQLSDQYGEDITIDVSGDFEKVLKRIDQSDKRGRPSTFSIVPRNWMLMAASLLLIVTTYIFLRQSDSINVIADKDEFVVVLPDNSSATMRRGSELSYQKDYLTNRIIELTGSALLDIVHDQNRPLEIRSAHMITKVLGTKFFLEDSPNNSTSSVQLIHGKVSVTNLSSDDRIILAPNEQAEITGDSITKLPGVSWTSFDWFKDPLNFENVELQNVMLTIESYFDVTIKLEGQAAACRFSGNFTNQSVKEILDSIVKLYGGALSTTDKAFLISGGTCE